MAILLDASTKSNDAWQYILNFVTSVARNFNVNTNCVRVAVIRYADSADPSIPLNRYGDINSLQQAVGSLTLIGGNSNLLTALQILRSQVFARNVVRQGARLVVGIVTDRLTCNTQITAEANYWKTSRSANILGIAVTSTRAVDISCLRQIVSSDQYIEVPDYRLLNNYASRARPYICPIIVTTPAPPSKYVVVNQYC